MLMLLFTREEYIVICQSESRVRERRVSSLQGQAAAGTSSFGMSGVNAHAVLCSAELQHIPEERSCLPWQRLRHWFAPAQHALLSTCAKYGGTVTMRAGLTNATLAYLRDHQVRVLSK